MNAMGTLCDRIASDAVHPVQHVLNIPIQMLYTVNDTYRFINDRLALFSNKGQEYSLRDLYPTDQE